MTEMIRPQTVKARATEGALGFAGTGNEQIGVGFVLLEGPDEGRMITWYGYFTEKTIDRTIESLRHCGWSGTLLTDMTGLGSQDVYIVIEHESGTYTDNQGEVHDTIRPRVAWVNAAGGVALKDRMNDGDAAAFAERMRGRILAAAQTQTRAPTSARRPAPPHTPHTPPGRGSDFKDDDIPF